MLKEVLGERVEMSAVTGVAEETYEFPNGSAQVP